MQAATAQEWRGHPGRCGAEVSRDGGAAVCAERTIARLQGVIARVHEIAERSLVRGENNSVTLVGGVFDMITISRITEPCPRS